MHSELVKVSFNVITLITFIFLLFQLKKKPSLTNFSFLPSISKKDIWILVSFLVFFVILNWNFLNQSLVGDEIYHAKMANRFSLKMADAIFSHFEFLKDFSYSNLLQILNLFGVAVLLFIIVLLKKYPKYSAVFLVLLFGYFHNFTWLSNEPHPPLRLFPLWLISSLLGMSNFGFRLPQTFALVLLSFVVWRVFTTRIGQSTSYLLALAVATLPVVLHVSVLVEFSIWTTFVAVLILLTFFPDDNDDKVESWKFLYLSWSIALGALIRQPIFLLSIPLVMYFFIKRFKKEVNHNNANPDWMVFLPLCFMLPFISKSILLGTPATYIPSEEIPFISSYLPAWKRLFFVLQSGAFTDLIIKHLGFLVAFICLLALVPFRRFSFKYKVIVILSFLVLYLPFYLIRPSLWGAGRYYAEALAPFYAIGLIELTLFLAKKRASYHISKVVLAGLIVFNLFEYQSLYSAQLNVESDMVVGNEFPKIVSKKYYDWDSALVAAKKEGYGDSLLNLGVVYGVFPLIKNGYSFAEVKKASELTEHGNSPEIEALNADPNLKLILISENEVGRKIDYISELQKSGWKIWKIFPSQFYNDNIVGLIKD